MARIIIVGAGIGGLTAAATLRHAGFEVRTVERAVEFGEVGAGVQLGPHATRVLAGLGLGDHLQRRGIVPSQVMFLRWQDSSVISAQSVAESAVVLGAPYYTFYRPELIEMLASLLPEGTVRHGVAATGITTIDDKPAVQLDDGNIETADLVVGADGTHSTVRAQTIGDAIPRFSGMCAYRALIPLERLATDPQAARTVRCWMGPTRHLVVYPVGGGPRYLNVVAVVPESDWQSESWTSRGSVDELHSQFRGWSPDVIRILHAVADPVYRWALYDRSPLDIWSTETTTLLGDACHPMLPFLAQGAAQAIGDAAALGQALSTSADLADALRRYEAARREHTAEIQRLSWQNNEVYHLLDGPAQQRRDEAMAQPDGAGIMAWIFANDPYAVPCSNHIDDHSRTTNRKHVD